MSAATQQKSIWITGATGYLGRSLLRARVPEVEKCPLVLLTRKSDPRLAGPGRMPVLPEDAAAGFGYEELARLARKHPPSHLLHFATEFRNAYQPPEAASMIDANLQFPIALLEACREIPDLRILNFGTFYSHADGRGDSPLTFYAATKTAFESFLSFYAPARRWGAVTLKIFDTYGPQDPRPKLLPKLWEALQSGAPFATSPGEQRLNLVHVDDIVRAVQVALQGSFAPGEHRIYQLPYRADPRALPTLREVVATLEKVTGKKVAAQWGALPYREREIMLPRLEFPVLPGWKPQVTLEEGLRSLAGSSCG